MAFSARVSGNVAEPGSTQINNVTLNSTYTTDDVNRACLHALQCPNSLDVKTRLKEKDKLLFKSIEWIFLDEQYSKWQNNEDVSLLWIRGGAGKGKTMTSIGLIEQLGRPLQPHEQHSIVAYFFCQNDDYKLNSIEGILKGLILSLLNQRPELFAVLRHKWDTANWRFEEDLTSWRALWNIFLDMLQRCKSMRLFVVIDALDECQDDDMPTFLQLVVRTGMSSDIKWLVTSRPFDSAGRELLSAPDQLMVNLELNSNHVTKAVQSYIHVKVAWLARQNYYESGLHNQLEAELNSKAEDTYLWVSLACKSLDGVKGADVMATLAELPPGLMPLYRKMFEKLCGDERRDAESCIRLLKVMLLVYRPLRVDQVSSASDLDSEQGAIDRYIDLCASFVTRRGVSVEFVHKSARDFLAGEAQADLDSYQNWGHAEIALSCVSCLSRQLKVNLLDLPEYDSGRESVAKLPDMAGKGLLDTIEYAATLWVRHLVDAQPSAIVEVAICDQGKVVTFLHTKVLEWFECLSLLDQLSHAVEALRLLANTTNPSASLLAIVRDADRFLSRHYNTIATWPLQLYSSAIPLSPQNSLLRTANSDKKPQWLKVLPSTEAEWTPLVKTLQSHVLSITCVAFSPDSNYLASGSDDTTVQLWDTKTGSLQKTFKGHHHRVSSVTFLSDSKHIASGSYDQTIKLWDVTRDDCQNTLTGHTKLLVSVAFSKKNNLIASASFDMTVKLWDALTGKCQKTLEGHSESVTEVAFSPDGKLLASASADSTIKLWSTLAGECQMTLKDPRYSLGSVAFSPNGKLIASIPDCRDRTTIWLWDIEKGTPRTLQSYKGTETVAFSHDSKHVVAGVDNMVFVLDAWTNDFTILTGHTEAVLAVKCSPDGKHIASASKDGTIKLWNPFAGDRKVISLAEAQDKIKEKILSLDRNAAREKVILSSDGKYIISVAWRGAELLDAVTCEDKTPGSRSASDIAFSPDGNNIAMVSEDGTFAIWDLAGGTRRILENSELSRQVTCAVFSPDGKHIASGSVDGKVKLWDLTKNNHKTLGRQGWGIRAMTFSADGKYVAVGCQEGKVRLWDLNGHHKELGNHPSTITAIAFSTDGSEIASSCCRAIKIWKVAKATYFSVLSRFKGCLQCGIKTPELIKSLRYSEDEAALIANCSRYLLNDTVSGASGRTSTFSRELWVHDKWLCYGMIRLLLIGSGCDPTCQDTRGGQVAVGLENGKVLVFEIDRAILDEELRSSRISL